MHCRNVEECAGAIAEPPHYDWKIGLYSALLVRCFVFAGLWEGWKKPGAEDWLHTCSIITCKPNQLQRKSPVCG